MNYQTLLSYRKIGGFLRFFQVVTIITIVAGALGLINELPYLSSSSLYGSGIALELLTVFTIALFLLARIFYLVFLNNRSKNLPLFYLLTHIGLCILSFINAYFSSYYSSYYLSLSFSQVISAILLLIIAVCVFIYFKKSERYRIYTMTESEYLESYAYYSSHLTFDYPGANMWPQGYQNPSSPQQPYYPVQNSPYSPQPYGAAPQYPATPMGGQVAHPPMQPYGNVQPPYAPQMNGQAPIAPNPPIQNPQPMQPQAPGSTPIPLQTAQQQPTAPQAPISQTPSNSTPSPQATTAPTYTGQPLPKLAPQESVAQFVNPYHPHQQTSAPSPTLAQTGQPLPTYTGEPLPPISNPYTPNTPANPAYTNAPPQAPAVLAQNTSPTNFASETSDAVIKDEKALSQEDDTIHPEANNP